MYEQHFSCQSHGLEEPVFHIIMPEKDTRWPFKDNHMTPTLPGGKRPGQAPLQSVHSPYCTVRFLYKQPWPKKEIPEKKHGEYVFVCYRQTAKRETDVDAENRKKERGPAGARVPSKGGQRFTARRYLVLGEMFRVTI